MTRNQKNSNWNFAQVVDKVKGIIIGEDKQRILQVIQEVMTGYSWIRIGNDGCIELNIEVFLEALYKWY